jgi:cytosine/adenosine deaminase-related metal-dependent hydrolase
MIPDKTSHKSIIEDVLIVTMNRNKDCFVGTISIVDSNIAFVGPNSKLHRQHWKDATRIQHPKRCMVLPGFIDGHVHANWLAWRYGGKEGLGKAETISADAKLNLIQRTHREAIRAGITFLSDFAPYKEGALHRENNNLGLVDVLQQFKSSRIGGCIRVRLPKHEEDRTLKVDAAKQHLKDALRLAPEYETKGRPLLLFLHLPVEDEEKYSPERLPKILKSYTEVLKNFKDEKRLWVHAHCCEYSRTAQYAQLVFGKSSIDNLASREYELLYERTILAHCIHISERDVSLIKDRDARVLTVPKFTDGHLAPVCSMITKGIPLGLCSDTYAIDPVSRMIHAYHLHRYYDGSPESRKLEKLEPLKMATIGGATVFNLDDEMGSIEIGKDANIVLLDLSSEVFNPFWTPDFWNDKSTSTYEWPDPLEPLRKLIQCGTLSCRDVCKVIVGGEEIYFRDKQENKKNSVDN